MNQNAIQVKILNSLTICGPREGRKEEINKAMEYGFKQSTSSFLETVGRRPCNLGTKLSASNIVPFNVRVLKTIQCCKPAAFAHKPHSQRLKQSKLSVQG